MVKVEIDDMDAVFVAKLKQTEKYLLEDIGKAILPCKDFQFEDLYNNFQYLVQIRALIVYFAGEYNRPLVSPAPFFESAGVAPYVDSNQNFQSSLDSAMTEIKKLTKKKKKKAKKRE